MLNIVGSCLSAVGAIWACGCERGTKISQMVVLLVGIGNTGNAVKLLLVVTFCQIARIVFQKTTLLLASNGTSLPETLDVQIINLVSSIVD